MNVIDFSKFNKEREIRVIAIAREIEIYFVEEESAIKSEYLNDATEEEVNYFYKYMRSLADGSFVRDHTTFRGSFQDYALERYMHYIASKRAISNGEYELAEVDGVYPVKVYSPVYRESDESFHDALLSDARVILNKFVREFKIPEIEKLAS